MQTQGLSSPLKTRETPVAGADGSNKATAHPTSIGRIRLIAFVVGAAVGSWSAWGIDQVANAATAAVSAGPAVAARTTTSATAGRRSIFVAIPREGEAFTSATIPVAGTAFGRPHGPRVRTVRVELIVGDQVVAATDIDVFSGRFAGVLRVAGSYPPVDAQLRVSQPGREKRGVLVKNLTVDPR